MDLHGLRVLKFEKGVCESSNNLENVKIDKENENKGSEIRTALNNGDKLENFGQRKLKKTKMKCKNLDKRKIKSDQVNNYFRSKTKNKRNKSFTSLHYMLQSLGNQLLSPEIKNEIEHRKKPKRKQSNQLAKIKDYTKDVKILFVNETSKLKDKAIKSKGKRRHREKETSIPIGCVDPSALYPCETNFATETKKCKQNFVKTRKRFQLKRPNETSRNRLDNAKFNKLRQTKSTSSSCNCRRPIHCNVIDFPECNKILSGRSSYPLYKNIDYQCKDQQVSTSYHSPIIEKSIGEAAVGTSRSLCSKKVCTGPVFVPKFKKPCKSVRPDSSQKVHTKPLPLQILVEYNFQDRAKMVAKYFLFAIMFVLWFPCIVLMALCWLVTNPFRTRSQVAEKPKLLKKQPTSSIFQSILSLLSNCSTKAVDRFIYSGKIIASLVKINDQKTCIQQNQKRANNICSRPVFTQRPDPEKIYTLFYAKKRGWMVKPVRKDTTQRNANHSRFEQVFYELCACNGAKPCGFTEKSIKKRKVQNKSSLKKHLDCECGQGNNLNKKVTIREPQNPTHSEALQQYPRSPILEKRPSCYNHQGERFGSQEFQRCPLSSKYPRMSNHHHNPVLSHSDPITNRNYLHANPLPPLKSRSTPHTKQCSISKPSVNSHKLGSEGVKSCHIPSRTGKRSRSKCSHSKTHLTNSSYRRSPPRNELSCHYFNPRSVGLIKNSPTKEHEKKVSFARKVFRRFKTSLHVINDIVEGADTQMWAHLKSDDMYAYTLRRKPCFWIYRSCPSAYPCFLTCHSFCGSVCHTICYLFSLILWCPIVFCSYICCQVFCKSC
ncbi:uncharacterized protein LOC114242068 [Bombyx mandarina]|uniref:Uncharacterized protein LOC114242068 n=1 Tax=Bombyx mandarina TaxID=7092 RepID=A0A6J2JH23_BOMMA|nr:uncharacterized protein LOC114242068 [Bombyx mandarina]